MTIDNSLKVRRGLVRVRSVMTRAERLTKLKEAERWKEGDSVLGLPKVRVSKVSLKKKKVKKKEEEGAEGAAAAAGTPAAPAAGAAGKKPAADAKKPDAKKPEAKKVAKK